MADAIPFSVRRNAKQQGLPESGQTLAADAALGDVARMLHAITSDDADLNALTRLSAGLLALLRLVQHEPSCEQAVDALYTAAHRLVHPPTMRSPSAHKPKQDLYEAYGVLRTHVVAAFTHSVTCTSGFNC
jgi:hypothetical protein